MRSVRNPNIVTLTSQSRSGSDSPLQDASNLSGRPHSNPSHLDPSGIEMGRDT
jgi:hypothetical protein